MVNLMTHKLEAKLDTWFSFNPFWRKWEEKGNDLTSENVLQHLPYEGEYHNTQLVSINQRNGSTFLVFETYPAWKHEDWDKFYDKESRELFPRKKPTTNFDNYKITPQLEPEFIRAIKAKYRYSEKEKK